MKLDELKGNEAFSDFYLMRNIKPRKTKAGKPVLAMTLADGSASNEAMV